MLKFLKVNLDKSSKFLHSKFHDRLEYLDKWKLESVSDIEAVEFEVSGKQVSYIVVDERQFDNFKYVVSSLDSKILEVEDLTKSVLFDDVIESNFSDESGKNVKDEIQKLILRFKNIATDCDVVLDKLLEKGMDSLTEFDKQFLK
jgi:hypothetical protein